MAAIPTAALLGEQLLFTSAAIRVIKEETERGFPVTRCIGNRMLHSALNSIEALDRERRLSLLTTRVTSSYREAMEIHGVSYDPGVYRVDFESVLRSAFEASVQPPSPRSLVRPSRRRLETLLKTKLTPILGVAESESGAWRHKRSVSTVNMVSTIDVSGGDCIVDVSHALRLGSDGPWLTRVGWSNFLGFSALTTWDLGRIDADGVAEEVVEVCKQYVSAIAAATEL